ncbi:MAG: PAS domain-containing protein [SAR324 cluster bacterium]|nr:PAS domain-containing protein [SAR324 cluster bacterium]
MLNWISNLIPRSSSNFMPHGQCFLWDQDLILLHSISDGITALAYYSIPVTLLYFIRKRSDIPFHGVFLMFSLFIFACGTTHFFGVWTLWHPDYWLEGILKSLTAIISLMTALLLFPLMPKAIALPRPAQLAEANRKLEDQIRVREAAESELQQHKDHLEELVAERTEELKHLRNLLSNVINSMPSVLIGVDLDGKVIQWNNKAEEITQLPKEAAQGCPLIDVFPQLSEEADNIQKSIKNHKTYKKEKKQQKMDDHIHFSDITIYPLIVNDVEEGAVIRIDDVTKRVLLEENMVQNEKMRSVGGLAAGMAHEINNPLSVILQSIQNIQRFIAEESPNNIKVAQECGITLGQLNVYLEKRKIIMFIEGMQESATRASKIVRDMLNFSRRSNSSIEAVDLVELLDKTIELAATDYDLKREYDFRNIHIERDFDSSLPPIPCIGSEIQQVFLNLFRNAAHALFDKEKQKSPQSTYAPKITLRTWLADQDMVRIEVEDNGSGMDDNTQKRLFEPFYTTKEIGKGTGLGLSVSYFIITTNHKGRIDVKSVPHQGSTFIIHLHLNKDRLNEVVI